MNNYYPKSLVDGVVITNAEQNVYTVPDDALSTLVTEINIVTEDAAGEVVRVYFKPAGDSAGLASLAYFGTVSDMLPGYNFRRTVLDPGTIISVIGGTGNIASIRISGAEER